MSDLVTIKDAARAMAVSRSTVYRLIQARVLAEKVEAGRLRLEDVPESLRPYLGSGFPVPTRISPRSLRLDMGDIRAWLEQQRH